VVVVEASGSAGGVGEHVAAGAEQGPGLDCCRVGVAVDGLGGVEVDDGPDGDVAVPEQVGDLLEQHRPDVIGGGDL